MHVLVDTRLMVIILIQWVEVLEVLPQRFILLTDALGNPIKFLLTAGNVHDIIPTKELLEGIKNTKVLADKAYFSEDIIEYIKTNGNEPIIPAKKKLH